MTRRLALRRRACAAGMILAVGGCAYGPKPDKRIDFVLVYPGDGTGFDKRATAILALAAAAALTAPELEVTVAGYADASATPESNQILSRIRAQSVANALVDRGVARGRIHLVPRRALGADPGIESGRVEIRIGS